METQISKEFLQSIGVNVDDATYDQLVTHFGETLESRIVDEVVASLSDEKVEELAQLNNQSGADLQEWIKANVPELQQIAQDEVDILLGELAENAEQI